MSSLSTAPPVHSEDDRDQNLEAGKCSNDLESNAESDEGTSSMERSIVGVAPPPKSNSNLPDQKTLDPTIPTNVASRRRFFIYAIITVLVIVIIGAVAGSMISRKSSPPGPAPTPVISSQLGVAASPQMPSPLSATPLPSLNLLVPTAQILPNTPSTTTTKPNAVLQESMKNGSDSTMSNPETEPTSPNAPSALSMASPTDSFPTPTTSQRDPLTSRMEPTTTSIIEPTPTSIMNPTSIIEPTPTSLINPSPTSIIEPPSRMEPTSIIEPPSPQQGASEVLVMPSSSAKPTNLRNSEPVAFPTVKYLQPTMSSSSTKSRLTGKPSIGNQSVNTLPSMAPVGHPSGTPAPVIQCFGGGTPMNEKKPELSSAPELATPIGIINLPFITSSPMIYEPYLSSIPSSTTLEPSLGPNTKTLEPSIIPNTKTNIPSILETPSPTILSTAPTISSTDHSAFPFIYMMPSLSPSTNTSS